MLGRLLELGYAAPEWSFTDSDAIADWARGHINTLCAIGALSGYADAVSYTHLAAWIEGNKRLALIDRFYGIVDAFHVIALVGKKGAFLQRNRLIRGREDLSGDGGIGDIARRGQLVERQPGDAVHQHMTFVSPVELIPPLIVLVGGRVDAEGTVQHR